MTIVSQQKLVILWLSATFLFLFTNYAHADSYSRTPSGSGTYQEMTFNVTIDDLSSCITDWSIYVVNMSPFTDHQIGENVPVAENSHTFVVQFDTAYDVIQVTAGCDGVGGSLSSLEYIFYATPLFHTEPYVAPVVVTNLWGSNNGFWGSTTPSVIAGDLEASVQATGANIWPLIAIVGIPVGFLIALWLVMLINKELTPIKETKKEKKYDFIYHSADDLEFKNNYGKDPNVIVKRRRGRPKKII
jgi:hypothetical protein